LHLKTIEEELQGSIGKALGKQGQKIRLYVQLMQQEYQRYETLLQQTAEDQQTIRKELAEVALAYNEHRKQAIQARWELMVHRQAAGFIVNNHQHVMEHYPIAEALPIDYDDKENLPKSESTRKEKKMQQFGDQLDWWQRVGRWK
jgi:DNA gyrase/topoisomerase IV subunit A